MTDSEHFKILKQGVESWNKWREDNPGLAPDLSVTDLRGADLRGADLSRADLSGAILSGADLSGADLSGANLIATTLNRAVLIGAILDSATCIGAYFIGAILVEVDLTGANLTGADFSEADLSEANFNGTIFDDTDLTNTNFKASRCRGVIFADVDLSNSRMLETISHENASTIGIDTLYKSQGRIPETFLRGCGVPESLIANMAFLMKSDAVESSSENLKASPQVPLEAKAVPPEIAKPASAQPHSIGQRNQVFVSYSHNDARWRDKLTKVLSPHIRQHEINLWSDTQIPPGSKWEVEIQQALASAKVAVFLVTQDFLASDFIANEELPPLLKAAQDEGVTVLWVPISAAMYKKTVFADYQAVIDPKKPLDMFLGARQSRKLVEIGEIIIEAMNK